MLYKFCIYVYFYTQRSAVYDTRFFSRSNRRRFAVFTCRVLRALKSPHAATPPLHKNIVSQDQRIPTFQFTSTSQKLYR